MAIASSRPKGSKLSNPIARELSDKLRRLIPTNDLIQKAALSEVLGAHGGDVEAIKLNASQIIFDAEKRAYEIYREAEGPARTSAIEDTFLARTKLLGTAEDAVRLVAAHADALDQFFLSLSQSRKSRAGASVEAFFDTLFRAIGYKFDRAHVVNGTPDFIFPSARHFAAHSTDCIVFTCKRTLRERWRQITTEGSRGFMLFLGTFDSGVKKADLDYMKEQKVVMIVPEQTRREKYSAFPHVISLERFFADHLDPAMERWRRNGVI